MLQLVYIPRNLAWVFAFGGEKILVLPGERGLYPKREQAVRAAARFGLVVREDGKLAGTMAAA